MFYITNLWGSLSFILITNKCPKLVDQWIKLDNIMEENYGFPKNMKRRLMVTVLVTLLCTIGQISIFLFYNILNTKELAHNKNIRFDLNAYLGMAFPQVYFSPDSIFLGVLAQLCYIFCIFRMTYTDLFISFISSFLSIRFQQVTSRLKEALHKKRTVTFWREVREDYDMICTLCKEVDEVITNVIFVSYAANLSLLLIYLRYCTILQGMMVFTSKQDAFVVMAHFRSGTRNPDGIRSYSLQSCIEQCSDAFPDCNIEYDVFKKHRLRFIKRYENKHCVCKGRPTVLTEEVVNNIQQRIDQSSAKSIPQLPAQTASVAFYINTFVMTALFLKLATEWPQLMCKWADVEQSMRRYGWPQNLHIRINILAVIFLSLATIQFALVKANKLLISMHYKKNKDLFEYYITTTLYPHLFPFLKYSLWKGILLQMTNVWLTFAWIFNDIFIMVISTGLAVRFQQITAKLRTLRTCETTTTDTWRKIREDYDRLSRLTRTVDDALSYNILTSFINNLFFILIQLFNSLRKMEDILEKLYFFFSLGFMVLRTVSVSMYGAWIYDESKEPITILNSISSDVYNIEIKRLIDQIKYDTVALSGKHFFYITRGLILSISGAIVTYELVLIQFNVNLLHEDTPNNGTVWGRKEKTNRSALVLWIKHQILPLRRRLYQPALMALKILQKPPSYDIFMFIFGCGQILGVLPLDFVKNVKNITMRFRWASYKTIYSILHIILMIFMVIACIAFANSSKTGWSFQHIVRSMFYVTNLWGSLSFFLTTKRCPKLMDRWIKVDNTMETNYGFPKSMKKRSQITVLVTLLYAIGQICIFLLNNIQNSKNKSQNSHSKFDVNVYFKTMFPHVFNFLPYSIFIGFLVQEKTVAFWREVREDYNRICTLCKEVDEVITNIVFVSYTANLSLLLIYLRYCTILEGLTWEKLYNTVCFIVYLIRIFVISLYVSWVNDESKEPRFVLNSVSTSQYNSEIQIFLQQISFNDVAFTANGMFKVIRTIVVNIGSKRQRSFTASMCTISQCKDFQCFSFGKKSNMDNPKSNVTITIKSKDVMSHPLSVHRSLSVFIVLSQFFGLMPIYGITHHNGRNLQFKFKSIRFIYSLLNACGALICAVFCCIEFTKTGVILDKTATLSFYLCNFFAILFSMRVAYNWKNLIREWSIVEISMKDDYGFPTNVKCGIRVIIITVLSFGLAEHLFFILNALNSLWKCETQSADVYFTYAFSQVFSVVSYSHWKAILIELINILATFSWNFLDLFIILISFALTARFKQVSNRIKAAENVGETFWRKVREDYDRLSVLCSNVDKQIGPLITISYVSNLFFICIQLYNSFKPRFGIIQSVYFFYSFGFLLARIISISMYAAWINDESREPLRFLQSVPSELYNPEVDRFIQHIHTNPVGLTGSKFFLITRSFLLKVAGTIVTFELMLLQFGPIIEGNLVSDLSNETVNC
ncbi:hypothetical protein FQA39_LY11991 [Lamprigera yunnana]|nr:hypothetical protein FQA39_LY11991 [Lamprigera yunnana]